MESRKAYQYPPFYRIINITIKHKEKHIAEEAANIMKQGLDAQFKTYINGPAQPPVDRIRNQYLWELLLKLPKDTKLIEQCKAAIKQQIIILNNHPTYARVTVVIDVDAV